jgi:hypothetical protein
MKGIRPMVHAKEVIYEGFVQATGLGAADRYLEAVSGFPV